MVESRQIDGRTVTFRRETGSGPALVCVHGSADIHHAYDRLLDALPGRALVAVNHAGRVGTDGPPLRTAAEMEPFLSHFIEAEVEGDYLVAGHSLGGAVAIEHALTSPPARLKGLVLLATGARLRVHPMILQLFEQAETSGSLPAAPPGLYERGVDPDLVEEAAEARLLTPVETGAADWSAADSFERMQGLDGIRIPALIMAGSDDALTPPKYAEYLAAHIPENDLRVIQGAGHMLIMERAAEVSEAIESFYRSRDLS